MAKVVAEWLPMKVLVQDAMGFASNSTTSTVIIYANSNATGDSCKDDPELDLCESSSNTTGGRLLQSSVVAKSVLLQMATRSTALLVNSVDLIDKIIIMEMANGAQKEAEIVEIARRQTMLMQKMCAEVLLIALGVDVAHNLHELHETEVVIDGANKGIILGAPWAGVPTLSKFCTLDEMRKVTYKWGVCKPLVDEILGATNGEAVAKARAYQVVEAGDDLEHEMEVAVELYKYDNGTCNVAGSITHNDWMYLLNSVDYQRYYGQLLALQVVQVANDVSVQASKVQLTINMATTYSGLRTLIQGNKKHSSPPTQAIADELLLVYRTWQEISLEFDTVIYTDLVDPIMVEKVIRLSAVLLAEMDIVMKLYLVEVAVADPTVPAHVITIAGRQRMYFEKLALEANEVNFYSEHNIDTKHTLHLLHTTRDKWLTTHWQLLQGDTSNNVTEDTNLCRIKKMKDVKDVFDKLKTAAWMVADEKKKDQITEMIRLLPIAQELMNTAVDYYSNGVQTCPEIPPTLIEWQAQIEAVGKTRAQSQKTATDYIWGHTLVPGPNPGMVKATFWGADGTIGEGMVNAITKLRFGWGSDNVPAPFNERMREDISKVSVVVSNFSKDLLGNSTADVVFDSYEMLAATEVLMKHTTEYAVAGFGDMPVERIELSTRLEELANKMLKEALLIRAQGSGRLGFGGRHDYTVVISRANMLGTMAAYAEATRILKEGDERKVPKVIAQRGDIENAQKLVEGAYTAFVSNVQCVADPSCVSTQDTKKTLDALETEIHSATKLYFLLDPFVEEPFPWIVVIYVALGVLVCGVVGLGGYVGLKKAKS